MGNASRFDPDVGPDDPAGRVLGNDERISEDLRRRRARGGHGRPLGGGAASSPLGGRAVHLSGGDLGQVPEPLAGPGLDRPKTAEQTLHPGPGEDDDDGNDREDDEDHVDPEPGHPGRARHPEDGRSGVRDEDDRADQGEDQRHVGDAQHPDVRGVGEGRDLVRDLPEAVGRLRQVIRLGGGAEGEQVAKGLADRRGVVLEVRELGLDPGEGLLQPAEALPERTVQFQDGYREAADRLADRPVDVGEASQLLEGYGRPVVLDRIDAFAECLEALEVGSRAGLEQVHQVGRGLGQAQAFGEEARGRRGSEPMHPVGGDPDPVGGLPARRVEGRDRG